MKTKVLISCAVTAQLICGFVFAHANCWFSDAAALLSFKNRDVSFYDEHQIVYSPERGGYFIGQG